MRTSFERYLQHAFSSRIGKGGAFQQLLEDLAAACGTEQDKVRPLATAFAEKCWDQAKDVVLDDDGPLSAVELEVSTLKQRLLRCNLSATKGVAAARAARHAHGRPSIEADAVVFHESLHHLDEETRNLVLSIVLEKLWLFRRGVAPPSLVEALRRYAADVSLPMGYEDIEEMQARLVAVETEANEAKEAKDQAEGRANIFDKGFNKLKSDHNYLRSKLGLEEIATGRYLKEADCEEDEEESSSIYEAEVDEALELLDLQELRALRQQHGKDAAKHGTSSTNVSPMPSPNNESRWKVLARTKSWKSQLRGAKSPSPFTRAAAMETPTAHSVGGTLAHMQSPDAGRRAMAPMLSPVPPANERRFSKKRRASEAGGNGSSLREVLAGHGSGASSRQGSKQSPTAAGSGGTLSRPSSDGPSSRGRGHASTTHQQDSRRLQSETGGGGRTNSKMREIRVGPLTLQISDDSAGPGGGFLTSEAGQEVVAAFASMLSRLQDTMPGGADLQSTAASGAPTVHTTAGLSSASLRHARVGSGESTTAPSDSIGMTSTAASTPLPISSVAVGGSLTSSSHILATTVASPASPSGGPQQQLLASPSKGSAVAEEAGALTTKTTAVGKLSASQQELLFQTMLEGIVELSDSLCDEASLPPELRSKLGDARESRSQLAAAIKHMVLGQDSELVSLVVERAAACDPATGQMPPLSQCLRVGEAGQIKIPRNAACQTDVCGITMANTERQAAEGRQLKVVLKETHGKAKQLVDRCAEKGLGKQVNDIVEEIGFVAVGKHRSVFERLYADAVAHFDGHHATDESPYHVHSKHPSPAEELANHLQEVHHAHAVSAGVRLVSKSMITGKTAEDASPHSHHSHSPQPSARKSWKTGTSPGHHAAQEDASPPNTQQQSAPPRKTLKSLTSHLTASPQMTQHSQQEDGGASRRGSAEDAQNSGASLLGQAARQRLQSTSRGELQGKPSGWSARTSTGLLHSVASAPVLHPPASQEPQAHHRASHEDASLDWQLLQALADAPKEHQHQHHHHHGGTLQRNHSHMPSNVHRTTQDLSPIVGESLLRRNTSKVLSLPRLPLRSEHNFIKDESPVSDALGVKSMRARPRQWG